MKLVLAIIQDDDVQRVMSVLGKNGYFVTKLASTGGFLRSGNTTLISGVEDKKVPDMLHILEQNCKSRMETTIVTNPYGSMEGYMPSPVNVRVGGATIFVLDVEQFKKF